MFLEAHFETTATARADLLETQQQQSSGCKTDSKCVSQMMLSLLDVFACQVLNEVPKILKNGEVQKLQRAYVKKVEQ